MQPGSKITRSLTKCDPEETIFDFLMSFSYTMPAYADRGAPPLDILWKLFDPTHVSAQDQLKRERKERQLKKSK